MEDEDKIVDILMSWLTKQTPEERQTVVMPDRELLLDDLYDKIYALGNQITESQISMREDIKTDPSCLLSRLHEQGDLQLTQYKTEVFLYTKLLQLIDEHDDEAWRNGKIKGSLEVSLAKAKENYVEKWYVRVFCPYLDDIVPDDVKPALQAYRRAGGNLSTERSAFFGSRDEYVQAGLKSMEGKYGQADLSLILKKMYLMAREFVPVSDFEVKQTNRPYTEFDLNYPLQIALSEMDVPEDEDIAFCSTEFSGYFVVHKDVKDEFEGCLADLFVASDCLHESFQVLSFDGPYTRKLLPDFQDIPDNVSALFDGNNVKEERYYNDDWIIYDVSFSSVVPQGRKNVLDDIATSYRI